MGLLKTGIQAGVAYAAVNKITKSLEATAAAKSSKSMPPPHPPCNCPHCPFSQQAVFGNGSTSAPTAQPMSPGYAPPASASYYACEGAPVPQPSDRVLEGGAADYTGHTGHTKA
ncbi:hypothetical protein Q8F55_008329 [Vanrija albida]|uniref:Uncharacterized protein n=1 Tax=Vanrija albida TaxID=181172 RepID=A0ABR3PWY2_9TREE